MLQDGRLPPAPCLGHPACSGSMHGHPGSPTSPLPCGRATEPLSCDRSCAASNVSRFLVAQMCSLLNLLWLGDHHPPASCCDGEKLGEEPWDGQAGDQLALVVGNRGTCPVPAWRVATRGSHGTPRQWHNLARGAGSEATGSTSDRVTINLISVNPSIGNRITPVTTPLAWRFHLHRVSAADLQINAMAGGTVSAPAPAGS